MTYSRSPGSLDHSSSVTNGMNGWSRRNRLSRQKYATSCAAASPARSRSLTASRYQSQNSFHANPYAALIESWNAKLSIPDVISELALERRERTHLSSRCSCTSSDPGADAGGVPGELRTRRVAFHSLLQNRR